MKRMRNIIILTITTLCLFGCVGKKKVNYVWEKSPYNLEEYRLLEFDSEFWLRVQRNRLIRRDANYYSPIMKDGGKHYIVIYPRTIDHLHKRFRDRIIHPDKLGL